MYDSQMNDGSFLKPCVLRETRRIARRFGEAMTFACELKRVFLFMWSAGASNQKAGDISRLARVGGCFDISPSSYRFLPSSKVPRERILLQPFMAYCLNISPKFNGL